MPTFQLNEPDYFTPQNVGENDFLNDKLTTDQYGRWYSVQFEGNADTYLWQTKTAPEPGQKYYGQLEKTKSGKATKFKRLKEEGGTHDSSKEPDNKYLKDTTDIPIRLIIELLKYYDVQSLYNSPQYDDMIKLAQSLNDDAVKMIEGNRGGRGDNNETLSSAPSVKEVEKPAAGPLKTAWQERKNLPQAVTASDEYQYTDADIPEDL